MAVFWFGWGKKVKNAVSKKEFQDTINPLNSRITTLEQKKSLTTTVFYIYRGSTFLTHYHLSVLVVISTALIPMLMLGLWLVMLVNLLLMVMNSLFKQLKAMPI